MMVFADNLSIGDIIIHKTTGKEYEVVAIAYAAYALKELDLHDTFKPLVWYDVETLAKEGFILK